MPTFGYGYFLWLLPGDRRQFDRCRDQPCNLARGRRAASQYEWGPADRREISYDGATAHDTSSAVNLGLTHPNAVSGYTLWLICGIRWSLEDDRCQARSKPSGLDGRARQPLPLQRRLRRAHAQASQPDITVPSLLLTTTGRKPGEKFICPLYYGKTGDSCIVVASNGGALQHPGWYRNLVANPEVEVQVGTQKIKAGARTATGEERTRLWQEALKFWPPYAEYSARPSARSRWWCWILCAPGEPCGKMLPR